jgi:hypothetical protein
MARITYLLGAGASCKCLPTYANFSTRFATFQRFISDNNSHLNGADLRKEADNILSSCIQLSEELVFHNTPDTVAKKYFHLNADKGEKLSELKRILSLYFFFEQSLSREGIAKLKIEGKDPIDRRYDAFIASILEPKFESLEIDKGFNILTWNYDLQFEITFANYLGKNIQDSQKWVQSIPSTASINDPYLIDPNKFSIVHLNGIAYSAPVVNGFNYGSFADASGYLLEAIVNHYQFLKKNVSPTKTPFLNFAWERDKDFPQPKKALNNIFYAASKVAEMTEVLVIIGYSFPIFNRAADTLLFSAMKNLQKVYIQSPNADVLQKTLVEVFELRDRGLGTGREIVKVENLDSFHIPIEWTKAVEGKVEFQTW